MSQIKFHYVYILHSGKDNQLYTGYTNDLRRRMQEHEQCPIHRASLAIKVGLLRSLSFTGRCHKAGKVSKNRLGQAIHQGANRKLSHGVKVGAFEPEFAGKMDFYLTILDEKERAPGDQPSIGIILCAEKDDIEVEYALRTKSNAIGVATYELQSKLPGEFKGKLPTQKQLADLVRAEYAN